MQHESPSGIETVVVVPSGLGESVDASLVVEDALTLELLIDTPFAVEQIEDVVDVSTEIKGSRTTSHVEIELLRDSEIQAVNPRSNSAVTFAVFATVSAQIRIIGDEGLIRVTVLRATERHAGQFVSCRDVNEL